jgi:hypothetical protein
MADKKNKSKTKDPYLERNEFKKGFYNQPDKPPVTAETMYGTGIKGSMSDKEGEQMRSMRPDDRDAIRREANRYEYKDLQGVPSDVEMERLRSITPEQYQEDRANPYSKGSYKEGGEIHLTGKDKNYIKDLIK